MQEDAGLSGPVEADTRELARRARDGDDRAFGELIRRYEGAVFGLALRITGSRAEAEDAAQEAFLRAYRALPRFDPERPFGPWILKIAANRALSRAGRRKREAPLDEAAEVREEKGMETAQSEREDVERLRRAMADLAPADRMIISLKYDQGLKLAEIADILGVREGAAKVRLFRARERLMLSLGTKKEER